MRGPLRTELRDVRREMRTVAEQAADRARMSAGEDYALVRDVMLDQLAESLGRRITGVILILIGATFTLAADILSTLITSYDSSAGSGYLRSSKEARPFGDRHGRCPAAHQAAQPRRCRPKVRASVGPSFAAPRDVDGHQVRGGPGHSALHRLAATLGPPDSTPDQL